jgi:hypothetical protein
VAELADALDSGSSDRKVVEVRILSWANPLAGNAGKCAETRIFTGFLKHQPMDKETQIYPSFSGIVATVATVATGRKQRVG